MLFLCVCVFFLWGSLSFVDVEGQLGNTICSVSLDLGCVSVSVYVCVEKC